MDLLKKTILAGIGATVVTKEALERVLQEWVEKGKVSSQEAGEMVDKIAEEGRREFEKVRQDWTDSFEEMLRKSQFATRKEMAALEARLQALESRLPVEPPVAPPPPAE